MIEHSNVQRLAKAT